MTCFCFGLKSKMCSEIYADELEKEIMLMNQELIVKRTLLDECRRKLHLEISQHAETKSTVSKYLSQNRELQTQLEMSLAATQKLEEENKKCREATVKLQVQVDAYLNERQQLIDRCFQAQANNETLKTEITDLKEQMKGHVAFQKNYKARQLQTAKLVEEIVSKQEILNKEQIRLENVCKEGLQFAQRVAEEAKFQAEFVRAADASQRRMEEEMIGLMTALREFKEKNETKTQNDAPRLETYLHEWKTSQQESQARIQSLQEQNRRLVEELNFATAQIEQLVKSTRQEMHLHRESA